MALGISLISSTTSSLKVKATGFSSSVAILNWYIDDAYDGSVSINESGWPTWTFTGLYPNTTYAIKVAFFTADGTRLDVTSASFTTDDAPLISRTFYARVRLYGNGGTSSGNSYIDFENWGASWEKFADIDVDYNGSSFRRSGYSLLGFSTSSGATSPSYSITGTYTVEATSEDESRPTTVKLYAVWKDAKTRPDDWVWSPAIVKGSSLSITARHWNDFISRIQEFASYLGVTLSSSTISAANATSGERMLASQANAARTMINSLSPSVSVPASVTAGDVITAAFMNGLKNSLNSSAS